MILKSLNKWTASILVGSLVFFITIPRAEAQNSGFSNRTEALNEVERLKGRFDEFKIQGDYENARKIGEEILTIQEEQLGSDSPSLVQTLHRLASVHQNLYAYDKSETYYLRAIKILKNAEQEDFFTLGNVMNDLAWIYEKQFDFDQAKRLYTSARLKYKIAVGPDHPSVGTIYHNTGRLYRQHRKLDVAEKLVLEALRIRESALGPDHYYTGASLSELGNIYRDQGSYDKAEPLYLRNLDISEKTKGHEHYQTGYALSRLAGLYEAQGFYDKAEPLYMRALDIAEKTEGPEHLPISTSLGNLAGLYKAQGFYDKAEPLYIRALEIAKKSRGEDHISTATYFNNLASLYENQSYYDKAEPLYLRALSIKENFFGYDHPSLAANLNNLALLYEKRKSYDKAESLMLRALAVKESSSEPNRLEIAASLNNLGFIYDEQGLYEKAEPLYARALEIREEFLDMNHPDIGASLSNLANVYDELGEDEKAEAFLVRSLRISEQSLGIDHPDTAIIAGNLGYFYDGQGNFEQAEKLYIRALEASKKSLGADHVSVFRNYGNLARLYSDQGELARAQINYKSAVELIERRVLLSFSGNTLAQSSANAEIKQNRWHFYNHAVNSRLVADEKPTEAGVLLKEAYSSSQYSLRTSAGAALDQAATRFAATDNSLAKLVRQRQNLSAEWSSINDAFTTSISTERDIVQEQIYREKLDAISKNIVKTDVRLEENFPEYTSLTSPKPLAIEDTQNLLYDNEALVLFLSGDKGTLVFAVTRDRVDWRLVDINSQVLDEAVRVLRSSLDNPQNVFPRGQAHGIYKKLMGEVGKIISDKDHVFLVPSGGLESIPLGVLVTEKPLGKDDSPDALRRTKWWGTQQALTTLPSISSLKALRLFAKDGSGREPFAGFGNPILDGPSEKNRNRSAQLASRGTGAYFKGQYGDVDAIRTMAPLPQTEIELYSLAKIMKADPQQSLWLGKRATETNLKLADLSQKRVLAFATHGLMSGEMSGLAEPALVLTPPEEATELDDGLLTASEAALLDLNADWVILSACNTAAADQPGADGLSGLARAFFYAGARSMLVSHWPVRDDAAARLTTTAIRMQDSDPTLGRSEALRRSMLVLMNDTVDPTLAHPSAWAPFVIVGEGGSDAKSSLVPFDPLQYKP